MVHVKRDPSIAMLLQFPTGYTCESVMQYTVVK